MDSREQLAEIARLRLYPSIGNPNYLVLRSRRLILNDWLDSVPGEQLTVLDIGGRYQPYRPLLKERVKRYMAIDVLKTPFVDVVGRGEQLPFTNDSFDLVIATGVFEYFPEPRAAAEEIRRVLKPNGTLVMSVASVFPRVVDEEHWHYQPAGLRYAFGKFEKIEIVPEVTSIGGFFRIVSISLSIFAKYDWLRWIVQHSIVPVLNITGLALESLKLTNNDQITGNFSVLVRK